MPKYQKSDSAFKTDSLNSITDPAFIVDSDFTITTFNRAAEQITGFKRQDVIGKKCYDILQTSICTSTCALKQARQLGEKTISHNIRINNNHDIELNVIAYSTPLFNEENDFLGGVEILRHALPTTKNNNKETLNGQILESIEKLRHNITLSDSILESIVDGAFSVDTDWYITSFNRAAEKITGVARHDAIGRKCYDIFKADICQSSCALKKVMETGLDVDELKITIRDNDGKKLPICINACVLRNESGEMIGGVETFRDCSTIEKLRHDITLSDSILESIIDGAFSVDTDWHITSFNQAAEKITGVKRHNAIGRKCYDIFKTDICKSSCALKKAMETGANIENLNVTIKSHKGANLPIRINASVLRNESGEMIGGVETFQDCSAIETLRKEISEQYEFQDIISKNYKIQKIFTILPNIAKSDSTVLIEGPSGSGKELFAKAIHTLSKREGNYIALNCAALPDNLLESELFGYKAGAFTGANIDKPGRFALAEGGTIFLDEIGDISPALQLRLLRVLQEKEYEPLGSIKTEKADVRVISASNKNLTKLVKEGRFRDDLFFRLNIIKIDLPPLSERREDIQILVAHFIQKFNVLKQKNIESASPEVISILMRHNFPGNIRELENIIEYCFVLCHQAVIDCDCLPESLTAGLQERPSQNIVNNIATPLSNAEAATILAALQECNGNRGKTSALLGIEKTTLWRKMKKYQIKFPAGKKN